MEVGVVMQAAPAHPSASALEPECAPPPVVQLGLPPPVRVQRGRPDSKPGLTAMVLADSDTADEKAAAIRRLIVLLRCNGIDSIGRHVADLVQLMSVLRKRFGIICGTGGRN